MSSERYDEQYVTVDGIEVLTYLVPDYDSDNDDIWEYFDGSRPRNKWLDGDLIVDRKHGWIVSPDLDLPAQMESPEYLGGVEWRFIDPEGEPYAAEELADRVADEGGMGFVYYRHSGEVYQTTIDEDGYLVTGRWTKVKAYPYGLEFTDCVSIYMEEDVWSAAPAFGSPDFAGWNERFRTILSYIGAVGAEYDNNHTEEGHKILVHDLPLMGHHEYRYFAAQRAGESDEEYAKILAAEYRYAENFGHTWGYYGVCAEWTPPENDLGYGKADSADASVWGVALDFGGDPYADEIRRDVASEVVEHAKAVLADMEEYRRALELEAQREAEAEEAQARRVFYEGAGL